MNKETLLKICDAVFEEGFQLGQEDESIPEYYFSEKLIEELEGLGFDMEKEEGCIYFLSVAQKQAVKKSRIEKVLREFEVNTLEDK